MNEKANNISTKDLSYFCDMFEWNLNCYNAFTHFEKEINEKKKKSIAQEIAKMHKESCEFILGLIKG